jgi:pyruvate dehydrogenase E1 component beta subunit
MKPQAYAESIRATLIKAMRADEQIVLLSTGGRSELAQSVLREFGADRIRSTPLDSSAIAAAAWGAAQAGVRVLVEIHTCAALASLDKLFENMPPPNNAPAVVFWLRVSDAHVCWRETGWLASASKAVVAFPSDADEANGFLAAALRSQGAPVLLLEHPRLSETQATRLAESKPFGAACGAGGADLPGDTSGSARAIRKGERVTVVACGPLVRDARCAVEKFEEDGEVRAAVLNLGTLRPLDIPALRRSLYGGGRLLLVLPDFAQEAIGSILQGVHEDGFDDLDAAVRVLKLNAGAVNKYKSLWGEDLESGNAENIKRIKLAVEGLAAE